MSRRIMVIACFAALGLTAAAQAPKIGKPRPAPAGPPQVLPLPPATIDNTLAVGGDDVKARKIETRLSVDVMLNGRGPYRFIVDSGADTSAVGIRVAQNLQLPLGTPVTVNGMTDAQHRRPREGRRVDGRPDHDPQPPTPGIERI